MTLLKTQTKRGTRPRLSDFEDVVRERAKDDQLKKGLRDAAAAKAAALAKFQEKPLSVEARARKLIAEGDLESDGVDLQAELRKATEKQDVYERAVQEQANTLRLVEGQRSRDVCAAVEPEFRRLVQDVVATIGAALQAEGRVRNFLGVLDKEGVLGAHGLLPTEPLQVEQLTSWLQRARAQGYDA